MAGDISRNKVYVYKYDIVNNNFSLNQTITFTGCNYVEGVSITNDPYWLAIACDNGLIQVHTHDGTKFNEE